MWDDYFLGRDSINKSQSAGYNTSVVGLGGKGGIHQKAT